MEMIFWGLKEKWLRLERDARATFLGSAHWLLASLVSLRIWAKISFPYVRVRQSRT